MEDSELTRKAIEELMKEMDEFKGKEIMKTERKKNPMGRPNKLFLGRTINSMLTHNKRQNDRNLQRCERKLKELDEKQNKKKLIKHRRARRGKTENLNEVISIESCDDAYKNKTSKRLRKKKIRKKQRRSSSSSSTSSTQTESSTSGTLYSQSKRLNRKTKKHKKASKEESGQQFDNDYVNDNAVEYYVDPNMAYAVMAYSQINHMMQQQQMFQQQIVKKELEESVEIPSDLSISCHSSSESSINISVNSSSAEEDENGILTFKLSSDDGDEIVSRISQKVNRKLTKINENEELFLDNEEIDKDSVHSHISLESIDSQKTAFKQCNEIYLLSSSCSDSEELEIVETISENISHFS